METGPNPLAYLRGFTFHKNASSMMPTAVQPTTGHARALSLEHVEASVVVTMRQTRADMSTKYKETSRGGLAVNVIEC